MAYVIAEPASTRRIRHARTHVRWTEFTPRRVKRANETADQLFIEPVECIDCGACVPVCPCRRSTQPTTCRRNGFRIRRKNARTSVASCWAASCGRAAMSVFSIIQRAALFQAARFVLWHERRVGDGAVAERGDCATELAFRRLTCSSPSLRVSRADKGSHSMLCGRGGRLAALWSR